MPYKSTSDLPDPVRNALPPEAEEMFREVYNSAYKFYKDPKKRKRGGTLEEVANAVAWREVNDHFEKDEKTGKWHKIKK